MCDLCLTCNCPPFASDEDFSNCEEDEEDLLLCACCCANAPPWRKTEKKRLEDAALTPRAQRGWRSAKTPRDDMTRKAENTGLGLATKGTLAMF